MNLGMLVCWEHVYNLKVKKDTTFNTEEQLRDFLLDEKKFTEFQVDSGFAFYNFAKETFSESQWEQVDSIFQELDEGRTAAGNNGDKLISAIGVALINMGNLFGTNDPLLMNNH